MTKTISITEDAYQILKDMKKGDESFSDVVKRLVKLGRRKTNRENAHAANRPKKSPNP